MNKACRIFFLMSLLVLLSGADALARQVKLLLDNGRRIQGELVSKDEQSITVSIAGVQTTFDRSRIIGVHYPQSVREEYQQRKKALAPEDVQGRLALARYLLERDTLTSLRLAQRELEGILELDPDLEQAQSLMRVVTSRIHLLQRKEVQADKVPAPLTPDQQPEVTRQPQNVALLTDRQIELIQVFEVTLSNSPRVTVPRGVVEYIFEHYRSAPALRPFLGELGRARFRELMPFQKLAVLFDLRARKLYDEVVILSEPQTMRYFRTQIHRRYILQYCGRCHSARRGEQRAPGLLIISRRPQSTKTIYTNYMILRTTRVGNIPLINTYQPARSLLLQFGLPRDQAIMPHPLVRGRPLWQPAFNGRQALRFQQMVAWISELFPEPYPIRFQPPTRLPWNTQGQARQGGRVEQGQGAAGSGPADGTGERSGAEGSGAPQRGDAPGSGGASSSSPDQGTTSSNDSNSDSPRRRDARERNR